MSVREHRKARTNESAGSRSPGRHLRRGHRSTPRSRPASRARGRSLVAAAGVGAVSWWATRPGDVVVVTRPEVRRTGTGSGSRAPGAGGARRHAWQAPASGRRGSAGPLRGELRRRQRHLQREHRGLGRGRRRLGEAAGLQRRRHTGSGRVQGSYAATHTWRAAGSYPVSFAVTTYTCVDGQATRGDAERAAHGGRRGALTLRLSRSRPRSGTAWAARSATPAGSRPGRGCRTRGPRRTA